MSRVVSGLHIPGQEYAACDRNQYPAVCAAWPAVPTAAERLGDLEAVQPLHRLLLARQTEPDLRGAQAHGAPRSRQLSARDQGRGSEPAPLRDRRRRSCGARRVARPAHAGRPRQRRDAAAHVLLGAARAGSSAEVPRGARRGAPSRAREVRRDPGQARGALRACRNDDRPRPLLRLPRPGAGNPPGADVDGVVPVGRRDRRAPARSPDHDDARRRLHHDLRRGTTRQPEMRQSHPRRRRSRRRWRRIRRGSGRAAGGRHRAA